MIRKKVLKIASIKETALVKRRSVMTIGEGQAALNGYLAQGYSVYNITANGGFSGITSAGGANTKIVCVFTAAPSGQNYQMQISYLGSKTSVIILGVVVNNTSALQVLSVQTGYFTVTYLNSDSRDYRASGLTFAYCNSINHTTTASAGFTGLKWYNCNNQQIYNMQLYFPTIQYTQIMIGNTTTHILFNYQTVINNCRLTINNNASHTFSGSGGVFKDSVIEMENSILDFQNVASITNVYIAFTNIAIRGSVSGVATGSIYIDELYSGRVNLPSATLKLINMVGKLNPDETNYLVSLRYFRQNTIDYNTLSALTFFDLYAQITPEYRQNGDFYQTMRNYYVLDFHNKKPVPDEIKLFNTAMIWVIKREDIDADLVGSSAKKIKDGILYNNDGATVYSYNNDENFIIIAANGSDNQVFLWYNGELYKTIWSDPMPGTSYTILNIYQFWKMEAPVRVRNVYDTDDSPLEGSITMNNMDNEVSA